jgi:hypothetical protein
MFVVGIACAVSLGGGGAALGAGAALAGGGATVLFVGAGTVAAPSVDTNAARAAANGPT